MVKHFFSRSVLIIALLCMTTYANALKVVFRLDDPNLEHCDSISKMAIQLFLDKQVPLSIAVIPCNADETPYLLQDSIFQQIVSEQPQIEIALHGLTHADINKQGEFGSLSAEETQRRICKGCDVLRSQTKQPIRTFIPPYNAVNSTLDDVLLANSINIISADMFNQQYHNGIEYFPETLGHLMARQGIWNAADSILRNCKDKDAVCIVMFHAYDLRQEEDFVHLSDILDYCKETADVELYTFSSLVQSGVHSNWKRYRSNQLHSGLQKLILPEGVLYPTWKCVLVHLGNALLYALFALIGMISICFIRRKTTKRLCNLAFAVLALIVFLAALFHWVGPIKLLACTIVGSLVIGIVGLLFRRA